MGYVARNCLARRAGAWRKPDLFYFFSKKLSETGQLVISRIACLSEFHFKNWGNSYVLILFNFLSVYKFHFLGPAERLGENYDFESKKESKK